MARGTLSRDEAIRWTRVGMLAALALLLGYAETFVPIPIPGVRLGLANSAVLVAFALKDRTGAMAIALIKVLALTLLFGSPLTLAYSLAGTLLSLLGMVPLSYLRTLRLEMLSVAGATLHVMGQLMVASVLLGTSVVWYLSPVLIACSCLTGLLCGTFAHTVFDCLPQDLLGAQGLRLAAEASCDDALTSPIGTPRASHVVSFLALLAFAVLVFHVEEPLWLVPCCLLSFMACALTRVPARALLRGLRPFAAVMVLTLVLQLLVSPETALQETARSAGRLLSVACASMAHMSLVDTEDALATLASLLGPLDSLGIPCTGFLLALGVALRQTPILTGIVCEELGGVSPKKNLRTLREAIPRIVRRFFS